MLYEFFVAALINFSLFVDDEKAEIVN